MLLLLNVRGALEQIWSNQLRSALTVLGIVIAVASTITVVSVVQGFTGYVADFLQGLGTNAMWVWPERPAGRGGEAARAGSSWTSTTSRRWSAVARPCGRSRP